MQRDRVIHARRQDWRKGILHRGFHRIRLIRGEEGKGVRKSLWGEGRGLVGIFRHQKQTARRGLGSKRGKREVLRLVGLLQSLKLQSTSGKKRKNERNK
jgi:hypothetical protein